MRKRPNQETSESFYENIMMNEFSYDYDGDEIDIGLSHDSVRKLTEDILNPMLTDEDGQ